MSQDQPTGDPSSDERLANTGTQTVPATDVLFGLLARATNRFVLQYLIDSERPVSVNELVEYAVSVSEPDAGETVGELRGSVRASVEHSVGDLASEGFLHHDPTSGTVEPTDRTGVAEPHLSLAREQLAARQ